MSAAPAVFHTLAIPSASVVRTVVAVAAVAAVALFLTVAAVWGESGAVAPVSRAPDKEQYV